VYLLAKKKRSDAPGEKRKRFWIDMSMEMYDKAQERMKALDFKNFSDYIRNLIRNDLGIQ